MGIPTIDERNPGRRKVERFSVGGALSGDRSNAESNGSEFLIMKNCYVDKRIGLALKRGGSTIESISGTLGKPLFAGELLITSTGSIPFRRETLVNFGGTAWRAQQAGSWSTVSEESGVGLDFSTTRRYTSGQLGDRLFIAGKVPAKWDGVGTNINRLGLDAPTVAPTIVSTASAGAITLTVGATYVITAYNSVNGLESDWSPSSTDVGVIAAKQIDIGLTDPPAGDWDKIRIYRTLDGGAVPYLVAEVTAGTASYTDNTPDASLGAEIARLGENQPPPESYIMAVFAQSIFMVDASNPYLIRVSLPYTGDITDLEYYPDDYFIVANHPITGLLAVPGKLLVFHARGVSFVSGFSIDDFVLSNFSSGIGTLFHHSLATNGDQVTFLAEQGIVSMNRGGLIHHISREIDEDLQPLLTGSNTDNLYVSTVYNPAIRQFIYSITVENDTLQRCKIWGWSQELSSEPTATKQSKNIWHEYDFPDIKDNNESGAYPTFLLHPQPSNDLLDLQQDKTYIGIYNGTGGQVLSAFRKDKGIDGSSDVIVSELLMGRIAPGDQSGGYKTFHRLGFSTSYSDPTSDGLATLKYLVDFEDGHLRDYLPQLISMINVDVDLKKFPITLAKHIHIYLKDESTTPGKILLGEFFIHYREKFRKQSR